MPEKLIPSSTEKTLTNSLGMAFVQIPAGTFQMGSNDANAYDNEKPVHRSASQYGAAPYNRGSHLGFRLLREVQ